MAPTAMAQENVQAICGPELSQEEARELAQEQFLLDSLFLEEHSQADFQLSLVEVQEQPGRLPGHYIAAFSNAQEPEMAYYILLPKQKGLFSPCGGGQLESSPGRLEEELRENYRVWTATQAWEVEKGPCCFWSYEDKARFSAEVGSEPGEWRRESSITVPGAEDVSFQEAQRKADAFLEEEFALTPSQIAAMRKDVGFYADHYTTNLGNTRCWLMLYRGELPGEDGGYPLLYQVTVPSPTGEVGGVHNFEVDTLMALGLSAHAAAKITELPTLYYIPCGGRFYHMVDDCASVPEKYLPMEGFDTGKLDGDPFKSLAPCPFCIQ